MQQPIDIRTRRPRQEATPTVAQLRDLMERANDHLWDAKGHCGEIHGDLEAAERCVTMGDCSMDRALAMLSEARQTATGRVADLLAGALIHLGQALAADAAGQGHWARDARLSVYRTEEDVVEALRLTEPTRPAKTQAAPAPLPLFGEVG